MEAIGFQHVSFSYDGHTAALDDLTLDVAAGEMLCVLGGNGSGKSTLARHIDGLLLPDAGIVRVFSLDTADPANLYAIRSSAGMVFQNPDDQIVATLVKDDVAFGPENLGVPSAELRERVRNALAQVGLQGFEDREATALSGGQKQRVAIAGALAMEPRILVLDEASAMLDPRGRKGLMKLCRQLNATGLTIVLITHFMEEAAQADRVVVLNGGHVALEGTPDQVLVQARSLQDLALDVPFAVQMSLALQDAGVAVGTCIDGDELAGQLEVLMRPAAGTGASPLPPDAPGASEPHRQRPGASAPEGSERTPVIEFRDVSFTYQPKERRRREGPKDAPQAQWGSDPAGTWALEDASFSLMKGDFLGIAGHTGSGKSTLIQLANGLLQPTRGTVLVNGCDIAAKRDAREARRSVGLVFQYPEHQLFAPTVAEDVAFGPRNLGLGPDEVDRRVRSALEKVHLDYDEVAPKSPFSLSGGQQRRVALAGVLAMEPATLILDEPTVGLDPRAHQSLLDLIAELHRSRSMTVAMVSHNMDDLAQLCNRIMLLNKGRIVADGSPTLVFSDEERLRSIGLGVPHTVHLADQLGIPWGPAGIPTIPQLAQAIAARCARPADPR